MSANVPIRGSLRPLDRRREPDAQVTEEQLKDAPRMARLLTGILRDVAELRRRWAPRRLDFEDLPVDATGTTLYRLPHSFRGAVRYWVVGWVGAAAPNLVRATASDDNTLVLTSTSEGVVTVRVEEAG